MKIIESGQTLGARIEDVDLSVPLLAAERNMIEAMLCRYGVICFPNQNLTSLQLKQFSERFGTLEINIVNKYQDPEYPEVIFMSNKVDEHGNQLGILDAGQEWHTDMSYSKMIAFANVLYAVEVPHKDGKPLGATTFANSKAAYNDLPQQVKERLRGLTAMHNYGHYIDMIRKLGSQRPEMTEEQKKRKPPVNHPVVITHPFTGEEMVYVNFGFTQHINDMSKADSEALLLMLYEHILQPQYRYTHTWNVGDVLMWDNLSTWHKAVADYGPDEHRFIKRCQVIADKYVSL